MFKLPPVRLLVEVFRCQQGAVLNIIFKDLLELGRQLLVVGEGVGLKVQPVAPVVLVSRADRGQVIATDHRLGVNEAVIVLVDLDLVINQVLGIVLRRPVHEGVVGHTRNHHPDVNSAAGRDNQGFQDWFTRNQVRRLNIHVLPRRADD